MPPPVAALCADGELFCTNNVAAPRRRCAAIAAAVLVLHRAIVQRDRAGCVDGAALSELLPRGCNW